MNPNLNSEAVTTVASSSSGLSGWISDQVIKCFARRPLLKTLQAIDTEAVRERHSALETPTPKLENT